ncbi:hypothetical protein IPZ58_28190 [Streptomyces roseoverticillatus]|uniref:hypothetical protein n=1 Tax=Streptomyces roseoverticillatus TaxID=66429 RepID=UPI001F33AD9A|nr:hypothetical protein [Streptomyces roseoverticillatus]MCF3105441.1 hypothetical protein [Streptomyces roseoverticillatus]
MRTLLDAAGMEESSDAVRLAVVVLAARTPSSSGMVEIRTGELGRWLGLSASYVASEVLPALRRSGMVAVGTAEGEFGQDNGLQCRVLPLWAAQGVAGHPLALAKKEFAMLLRLLEAVMAPGWTHRDGSVTPAGMLGSRTGRGAATDRLALLLLVLEARETGRVRQCGGTVDTKRGRAAATVARLLGCTASAGERVLERLEDRGLVRRVRLETVSGLAHRTRLMVPAVAAAHSRTGADNVRKTRAPAPESVLSDPDVTARPDAAPHSETETQVSNVPVMSEAAVAEPDVAAALHTDHSPLITPVSPLSLSGGISGEGRGGDRGLPDRACMREDGGPLRGEQPKKSPVAEGTKGNCRPVAEASARAGATTGQGRQPRRRPLPPTDLRTVLAPVESLWACLERRYARRLVEKTVRRELAAAAGIVGRAAAAGVLADRLARRLAAQGGPTAVENPVGWLAARGLPKRQMCGDVRCDEGLRMDTGGPCETCAYLVGDRRAQRQAITATVDAQMPRASETERRAEVERRLHQTVTAEGWAKAQERQQVEIQHATRQTATKDWACETGPATSAGATTPVAVPVPVVLPAPRPALDTPQPELEPEDEAPLVLGALTREQVIDWRARAERDHQLVLDHIDEHGELSARRLFTNCFVDRVLRLAGARHLVLGHTTWGSA